jgi:hypothetical protein
MWRRVDCYEPPPVPPSPVPHNARPSGCGAAGEGWAGGRSRRDAERPIPRPRQPGHCSGWGTRPDHCRRPPRPRRHRLPRVVGATSQNHVGSCVATGGAVALCRRPSAQWTGLPPRSAPARLTRRSARHSHASHRSMRGRRRAGRGRAVRGGSCVDRSPGAASTAGWPRGCAAHRRPR